MSIAITLLGHAPKKNEGRTAGSGGGGTDKFLHLAWANTEKGADFTKSNIDEGGHIVPYKYVGICLDDNPDGESLSFGSYVWTCLCPCGSGGGADDGSDEDFCDPADPLGSCYDPAQDPFAKIMPQVVEYVKPECLNNSERHTADQPYHLLFDDELTTLGYSLDKENKSEGAQAGVIWTFELKCQQIPILVKTAYDYYNGWVYYADLFEGWTAGITHVFTRLDDYLTASSGYARANDGKWHRARFETDPTLTFDNGTSAVPTRLAALSDNGAVSGMDVIERSKAYWEMPVIDAVFGEQKTMSLHECSISSTSYDMSGSLYNFGVYDSVIKYRWRATSFAALLAQLPKSYEIEHGDLNRHVDFYCTGETAEKTGTVYNNPRTNIGGGQAEINQTYYVYTKQGASIQYNQPTYSGWQSDYDVAQDPQGNTIYVRYFNSYTSSWLMTA